MPEFGQNFRTQIALRLQAEGLGEADKLTQEMLRVKRAIDAVREEFSQGVLAADLYRKQLNPLIGDLNFLVKEYDAVVGAQDKLEASGARAAAAFAKQEAAAEKAAMAHAGLAQQATLAVQAASDRINAALDKEVAATVAAEERKSQARAQADARHEADLQRIHDRHTAFLAAEETAEARANARHDAEMEQAHRKHLEFLAREEAAERAAAESLAAQKRQALEEAAAYEKRVTERRSERGFADAANAQIEALQRIGAQGQSNIELYKILEAQMAALVAKGSTRTNDDFDAMDRLKVKMREVWADMTAGAPAVRQLTDNLAQQNTVINAGAAYTRKSWTEFEWLGKHIEGVGWVFKNTAEATEKGGSSAQKASYGWLHFAHAVQDAQYGVGAVLNNIPLVVQAMGGGPGLAGTVMITAVAFETFRGYVGDVRTELGLIVDPMQAFALSSEDLKAKLAALVAKKWKLDVDYRDIERATEALHEHEKARAAFEAGKKTKAEGSLAEEAKKVVDAAGGTPELSKVVLGAAMARGMTFAKQSDIDEEKRLRDQVAQIEKTKAGALPGVRFIMEEQAKAVEAQRKEIEERIQRANNDYAMQVAGKFAEGNEDAIRMIKGLAERQPQAFKPDARRRLKELPETAEEKEWKDMAEESDKWINEQVEEGQKKVKADLKQAQDARAAEVGKHAAAFGGDKSLGGFLQGQVRSLIAGGEKDPERLRRGVMADAMKRIDESDVVPKGMVPDVAVQVVSRFVEKTIAELIDELEPGKTLVEAARKAIALAEAKAKAKEEKPEIAHEAARMGQADRENIREAILVHATKKLSDEAIRKWLVPKVRKRAEEAGVEPGVSPEVAAKLVDEELGKVRAQQAARGGVKPATARELLGEQQAKFSGQEEGRQKRVERMQGAAARPAVARQIFAEFGGNVSPEQATSGAEQLQRLVKSGENPARAQAMVVAHMLEFVRENIATAAQVSGMNEQMAITLREATMQLGAMRARLSMTEGRMKVQRWQQPPPWNTIGGG